MADLCKTNRISDLLRDAISLWLNDTIPHDNPYYAYLILLLLDDHSDQADGTVDSRLQVDIESLVKSVSFTDIKLPSLLEYLAENGQSVVFLIISSL